MVITNVCVNRMARKLEGNVKGSTDGTSFYGLTDMNHASLPRTQSEKKKRI
jgi:hypothetical protein